MSNTAQIFDVDSSESLNDVRLIPQQRTPQRGMESELNSESTIGKLANGSLTGLNQNSYSRSPLKVVAPLSQPLKGSFKLLQMWEGRVIDIDQENKEFSSVISDRTNPDFPQEEVTLDIEEISPDDLPLLSAGAIFYWSIGYSDYPGRPRSRESRLRFRRLPRWSKAEINKAKEAGEALAKLLKYD